MKFVTRCSLFFLLPLVGTAVFILLTFKSAAAESNPTSTLSNQAFQLAVSFEKQETALECGLAAADMVSGYYDKKLSKAQQDWLKSRSRAGKGLLGSDLVVALRAADFETAVFQGTLDKTETGLYYHLEKHRPVILMISSKDGKSSHYDVLTGYDPKNSNLFLLDPALGPITVTTKDFIPAWERAHYFSLVAVPQKLIDQTPVPTSGS